MILLLFIPESKQCTGVREKERKQKAKQKWKKRRKSAYDHRFQDFVSHEMRKSQIYVEEKITQIDLKVGKTLTEPKCCEQQPNTFMKFYNKKYNQRQQQPTNSNNRNKYDSFKRQIKMEEQWGKCPEHRNIYSKALFFPDTNFTTQTKTIHMKTERKKCYRDEKRENE